MAEDSEKKLKDLKQRLTLISTSLGNAVNQLKNGKVISAATITELQIEKERLNTQITRMEAGEEDNAPLPPLNLRGGGEAGGITEDGYGIPERLRIRRRPYTLSPEALDQRKKAAKTAKKAVGMIGNKNAWKHGSNAQGFIRRIVKPCHSTCEHYDNCSAIKEGETEAGGVCVSGHNFLHVLDALQTAMQTKKFDALQEQASIIIAGGFEVTRRIITELLEDGGLVRSEKRDKDGNVFYEIKNHPALPFLSKLLESQHLTIQDFMTTPLIIQKTKTEAKKAKGLAGLISSIGMSSGEDEEAE